MRSDVKANARARRGVLEAFDPRAVALEQDVRRPAEAAAVSGGRRALATSLPCAAPRSPVVKHVLERRLRELDIVCDA